MTKVSNAASDITAFNGNHADRNKWLRHIAVAIENQSIRIISHPILARYFFIGSNITYEIWIEIRAKVFNNRSVNDEIDQLNSTFASFAFSPR